jgi:hypothetical protein
MLRPLIIFCEEYKLWNTSLCYFLHLPAASCLLGTNILLKYFFSNILNVGYVFLLVTEIKQAKL